MTWLDEVEAERANGSFEKTMGLLLKELASRPDDAQVHYQIAWSHDALGKERDAAPAYEKAIGLGLKDHDLKGAYLGLGSTLRCLGQYKKSLETFDLALKLFPEERAFRVFKALTLYNLKQGKEAISILLKELAETSSDDSILRYQRALLFYSDRLDEKFE